MNVMRGGGGADEADDEGAEQKSSKKKGGLFSGIFGGSAKTSNKLAVPSSFNCA